MNRPVCKQESRWNLFQLEHKRWLADPHRERTDEKRRASRARRRHLRAALRRARSHPED